jgi:hypothetical protein
MKRLQIREGSKPSVKVVRKNPVIGNQIKAPTTTSAMP